MREILLVLSILLPILFFGLFVIFGISFYKAKNSRKFDFLTEFPYELLEANEGKEFLVRLFFDAFPLSMAFLTIFQITVHYESASLISFILLGGFIAIAFALSLISLSLVSASKEKAHTTRFVVSCALLTVLNFVNGIFLFSVSRGFKAEVAMKVIGGICFLFALSSLLVMFNPKLKNWPSLESVSEIDGSVSYRRPRPFVLAVSEWVLILISLLGIIAASIGNALVIL